MHVPQLVRFKAISDNSVFTRSKTTNTTLRQRLRSGLSRRQNPLTRALSVRSLWDRRTGVVTWRKHVGQAGILRFPSQPHCWDGIGGAAPYRSGRLPLAGTALLCSALPCSDLGFRPAGARSVTDLARSLELVRRLLSLRDAAHFQTHCAGSTIRGRQTALQTIPILICLNIHAIARTARSASKGIHVMMA